MSRHQKRHGPESNGPSGSSLNREDVNSDLQRNELDFSGTITQQRSNRSSTAGDILGNEFHLNWPDSENLLQSILSADLDNWPAFHAPELPILDNHEQDEERESPWVQSVTGRGSSHTGDEAVSNLTRLITSVVGSQALE